MKRVNKKYQEKIIYIFCTILNNYSLKKILANITVKSVEALNDELSFDNILLWLIMCYEANEQILFIA